jgi:hypothetical protein
LTFKLAFVDTQWTADGSSKYGIKISSKGQRAGIRRDVIAVAINDPGPWEAWRQGLFHRQNGELDTV